MSKSSEFNSFSSTALAYSLLFLHCLCINLKNSIIPISENVCLIFTETPFTIWVTGTDKFFSKVNERFLDKTIFWEACDVGLRDFPPGSSDLMGEFLGETPIKVLTQLPHYIKH